MLNTNGRASAAGRLATSRFRELGVKVSNRLSRREERAGVSMNSMIIPIVLGILIPLIAAMVLLIVLHRRNIRRQAREDATDPHKSLDFGLVIPGKGGRRSLFFGGNSEKSKKQLSMDLNLSSPYLLPPDMHQSRESMNSLARSINKENDPYRLVGELNGDGVSIHNQRQPADGLSLHDKETAIYPSSTPSPMTSRQNSMPSANPSPIPVAPAPAITTGHSASPPPQIPEPQSAEFLISTPPADKENFATGDFGHGAVPSIQGPAPVAQRESRTSMVESVRSGRESFSPPMQSIPEPASVDGKPSNQGQRSQNSGADGHNASEANQAINTPTIGPVIEEPTEIFDDYYDNDRISRDQFEYEHRGRSSQRVSQYYHDDSHPGLGVPEQDSKRLSVGFRPLPPDEGVEGEDAETRANRIRSFYKEYFEETKPEAEPPMPKMPQQFAPQPAPHGYYGGGGGGYNQPHMGGEGAYFDPETNAFVMPYAQPVARRAMTPPPSGSRFPGGPGGPGPRPPRVMHGSMSGMSMPGGLRGPPRPGSSVSNRPPAPGSRAGSAMSGRAPPPKKPLPPPAPLNTLPTPSKLKDDMFALSGMEFAPPELFKDKVAGRSQSPMGERRAYQPKVPAANPLVGTAEEMAVLPSAHTLRKSSTFTGLDFAPPRKFKDPENMSDAGSIKSNRSGLSAAHTAAIRSGAGRVSRLPEDTIFTPQSNAQLRPQWDMRS